MIMFAYAVKFKHFSLLCKLNNEQNILQMMWDDPVLVLMKNFLVLHVVLSKEENIRRKMNT